MASILSRPQCVKNHIGIVIFYNPLVIIIKYNLSMQSGFALMLTILTKSQNVSKGVRNCHRLTLRITLYYTHWMKYPPLAALKVIEMTNFCTTSDAHLVRMPTFPFPCMARLPVVVVNGPPIARAQWMLPGSKLSALWHSLPIAGDQATSHYLDQWWLDYRRIYASPGLNELNRHAGLVSLKYCNTWWFTSIRSILQKPFCHHRIVKVHGRVCSNTYKGLCGKKIGHHFLR